MNTKTVIQINRRIPVPKRNCGGHQIQEFAIGLFVLLFVVMFPLLDIIALGIATASGHLLVNQAASRAASQNRYPEALIAIKEESLTCLQNGFARFCKMQPIDGYQGCGIDLYIQSTDIHTNTNKTIGPNSPLPAPPDALSNVYEYTAAGKFQVSPLIPLNSLPLLGQVPGLGKPVILSFNSTKALEHLEGLSTKIVAVGFTPAATKGPYPGRDGNSQPANNIPNDSVGWNYPNIYEAIAAKGQTIVTEDVFTVPANSEPWTISSALCAPGQHVWIDTHAEGTWSFSDGVQLSADGDPNMNAPGAPPPEYGLPAGSLVSQVGDTGPVFMSGKSTLDYVPQSSGLVEFRMNDNPGSFANNMGIMVVRVIVTKAG